MKDNSNPYYIDPTRMKYYAKFGLYFNRLPLGDTDEGDDLSAMRAIEKCPDWKCPYCMNPCGDHTVEELIACLRTERARVKCPTCGKLDEDHLDREYSTCTGTRPVLKKATLASPGVLRLPAHSSNPVGGDWGMIPRELIGVRP